MNDSLQIISDRLNQLGESPVWHPLENKLYWLDCLETAIYCFNPTNREVSHYPMPYYLGALAYCQAGGFIATTRTGFVNIDLHTGEFIHVIDILPKDSHLRMNDGKCDHLGRFWAGSATNDPTKIEGTLFKLDCHGCTPMQNQLLISNGIGWSPDNTIMYHNDSLARKTYYYDFDLSIGEVSNQRLFWDATEHGEPDGLTVDSEGGIWLALWDGGKVVRLNPDGSLDQVIPLPVVRPTSLTFGGEDLMTLFITSCNHVAFRGEDPQPAPAGCLLALEVNYIGMPAIGYAASL